MIGNLLEGIPDLLPEERFEEDEEVSLGPGDHLLIPAHRRHRIAWTAPDEVTVWLALHFD